MNKKARDNRANQMNPNNPAYYKSRQGNQSKSKTKVVVHHHHHHNHGGSNQGFACKCCGKRGKLTVECYTISAVDKSPKIWYNKSK